MIEHLTAAYLSTLPVVPNNKNQLATRLALHDDLFNEMGSATISGVDDTGASNVTTALQAILDNGILTLPEGIFLISGLVPPSNCVIRGAGIGRTILRTAAGTLPNTGSDGTELYAAIGSVAGHHILVEDLTINLNTNSTTGNGLAFLPGTALNGTVCTDITVRNVEILGYDVHQYMIWSLRGKRMQFLNNRINGNRTQFTDTDAQEGIEIFGGEDVLVTGNQIRGLSGHGINVGAFGGTVTTADSKNIRVVGNYTEDCQRGISISSYSNGNLDGVAVLGNQAKSCNKHGVRLHIPVTGTTVKDVEIASNRIDACEEGVQVLGVVGGAAETHSGTSVHHNAIRGATTTTTAAIYTAYVPNLTIADNKIDTSANEGVRAVGSVDIAIEGNKIRSCQGNAIEAATCTRPRITKNACSLYALGSATPGILATGIVGIGVITNNEMYRATGTGTDIAATGDSAWVADNPLLYAAAGGSVSNGTNTPYTP